MVFKLLSLACANTGLFKLRRLHLKFSTVALGAAGFVLLFILGNAIFLYLQHAVLAVSYPYPLNYGEGLVLDQVLRVFRSEVIYPTTLTAAPFIVSNHPPLYILLQVPFLWLFGPAFWYGRAISLISLLAAAAFLGLTLYHLTHHWAASLLSSLLLFSIPYFWNWSVLNQGDTLALALSWAGLYTIVRNPDRSRNVVLAGVLFTAAVFTEQTYFLVAPVTALLWLLQTHRLRRALDLLAVAAGLCLALYLILNGITHGGFYLNLVTYNANLWNFQEVAGKLIEIALNTFILGLAALIFFLAERLDTPTRTWPFVLPYLLTAILITILVGKSGPNDGFMYELSAALCLVTGAAFAWLRNHWVIVFFLIGICIQVNSLTAWTTALYQPNFDEKLASRIEIARLADIIRSADGPVLVDEYNGLVPLSGKTLYYQPYEFAQLARSGLWDAKPLLNDLAQRKFSALLIYFPHDFNITRSRWPSFIYDTFWNTYTNTGELASNLICLPVK